MVFFKFLALPYALEVKKVLFLEDPRKIAIF